MIADEWLHRPEQFTPGAELFRSDREFQLWAYTVTHSQCLFRSTLTVGRERCDTTIDLMFKPVEAVQVQEAYRGLTVRCAREEEAARINAGISDYGYRAHDARVFVLESEGRTGYVVSAAIGWREGVLSNIQPSFFNAVLRNEPSWPVKPVWGPDTGANVASAADVAEAFLAGLPEGVRRDRYRFVHVLMAVTEDNRRYRHTVGVFLSEEDADESERLLAPKVASCWVESIPMVL